MDRVANDIELDKETASTTQEKINDILTRAKETPGSNWAKPLAHEAREAFKQKKDVIFRIKIPREDEDHKYWIPVLGGHQTGESDETLDGPNGSTTYHFLDYDLPIRFRQDPPILEFPPQNSYGYLAIEYWNARNQDGYPPKHPSLILSISAVQAVVVTNPR